MDRIIAVKWKVKVKEIELQQGLLESLKIEAWSCFFIDLHSTNSLFEQTVSDACYFTITRFQCVSFWPFVRF